MRPNFFVRHNLKLRYVWLTAVALFLLVGWGIGRTLAENEPNDLANWLAQTQTLTHGRAEINTSSLALTAELSPPSAQAGDLLSLNLTLRNQTSDLASPTVEILLPPNLAPSLQRLPTGVSLNVAEGKLLWQPLLVGQDSTAVTSLSLLTTSSTPDQAYQTINLFLRTAVGEQQTNLTFWNGEPPQGTIQLHPGRASVGQPVQFQAQTSGTGPFTQLWFTGDGRAIPANNPIVVYPMVGMYNVELQLGNPLTTHQSSERLLIVPDPAAFFAVSDTTPSVGQTVEFRTQGGGQPPLSYLWEFGDGSLTTEANPSYQYQSPGSYTVRHLVRNAYGEAQNYLTLEVGYPPIADMEAQTTAVDTAGVRAQAFTDDNTQEIRWEMGDGTVYQGAIVTHRYRSSGTYQISMTASNPFGQTIITRVVSVEAGQNYIYLPAILHDGQSQLSLAEELFTDGQLIPQNNPEVAISPSTIEFIEVDTPIVLEENPAVEILSPAEQLIWYINHARRQAGLNEVRLHPTLNNAAKQHSNDMANYGLNSHTGSDGSAPYERMARVGFRDGGYAGETTAWGFRTGREAVQFWLESPPHRAILLNPIATEVGVAQTTNYTAPNVWYWTAEFASSYGSIVAQMREAGIRQVQPRPNSLYTFGEMIPFSWSWPLPLEAGQRFVLYWQNGSASPRRLATVDSPVELEALQGQPQAGTLFAHQALVNDVATMAGDFGWYVQLEDGTGQLLTSSKIGAVIITGTVPTVTPTPVLLLPTRTPTLAATFAPSQPTATATPIAPPTLAWPTLTPQPTLPVIGGTVEVGVETMTPTAVFTPETPNPTSTPEPTPLPTLTPVPTITPIPTNTPLSTLAPGG
jgi:uncharacterized protein YkwD